MIALAMLTFILLTCSQRNELFTKPDGSVRCYAFTCDTAITAVSQIGDTVHFATIDTIHTADSVTLVGVIYPLSDKISKSYWTLSDGTTSDKDIYRKKFAKGGVYSCVFTIEDNAGITISDTVTVCVNTPPVVGSLIAPANGAKTVDPLDQRGIRFQWTASDVDGDSLKARLYISSDTSFLQPSAANIATSFYDYVGNLKTLTKYFWRIIVEDKYGETDTSASFSFTTKDPNASGGQLKGYAYYQGWKNHAGIKITVSAAEALQRSAVTNDSGFYQITNIDPRPNYTIIATDTIKGEFVPDTTHDTITAGALTFADTLRLKDPFKPVISNPFPTMPQSTREPVISATFSDRGSGILVSSARILFNDSNVTPRAIVSDSGLRWTPPARLSDKTFRVAVSVKDSAGNTSDTMKWSFTVDGMKLTILTPDTTVRIHDTLRLRSLVTNVYSKVALYKWDFDGNGTWDDSLATTDTLVSRSHVYTHDTVYSAIEYVRDDSGMVKLDTVTVNIGNLPPVISSIRADTTISIKDSIQFSGAAHDPDGTIKEYAWDFNGDGTFEYTSAMQIQAGYRYNTAGVYNAILRATDDDNKKSYDTARITVLQDAPVVTASTPDTFVSIKDTIHLHASATVRSGTIVKWEWDFGNTGKFVAMSKGDTGVIAPATATQAYVCVVRATDSKGNTSTATVTIKVLLDAPVPNAGNDTTVSINAIIPFHGTATQQVGTFVMWKWDFDGDGVYDDSSTTTGTAVHTYTHEAVYNAKLLVRDDDGNEATVVRHVTVVNLPPVISSIRPDTTISIKDSSPVFGEAHDVDGRNKEYAWDFKGDGTFDYTSATQIQAGYRYNTAGVYNAILRVTDDDNKKSFDTAKITVLQDAPVVTASTPDTLISIKDTIHLHATATVHSGTIAMWEWDFGNTGKFVVTSKGDTTIIAPATATQAYVCVVRATDSKGNTSTATVTVKVLQDAPIIIFFTSDTIVDHGGSVRCSVYVSQQFGTMSVEIDTANSGVFKGLGSLGLSGGISYSIPTGNACSWDSVKIRITDDDGNVVMRGFKVDIRPQPLTITSIDSTGNTIPVQWSQTQETDFAKYLIYRSATNQVETTDSLWATISASETVSYTMPTSYAWNPRFYRVYQKDNEGLMGAGSNVVYGNVRNSPPSTPVIAYPVDDGDTIWQEDKLRWHPSTDLHGNPVRYKILINWNNAGYSVFANAVTDTFVTLTGLDSMSMKYKVIAYDTTSDSSAWSTERSAVIGCKPVTDIDGNVYHTVRIGTQIWTVENLKTTRYNDGTMIPLVTDNAIWGALTTPGYCYYNDSVSYANPYGALYNWYTVNTGKLAPAGWHVPTDSEWTVLSTYLGGDNVSGGKLKEAGTAHWNSPNTGATNETGFSALPGGYRELSGGFLGIDYNGYWWSATEAGAAGAWSRTLYCGYGNLGRGGNGKSYGFSVRLVRD